jgi:hypothetical protein
MSVLSIVRVGDRDIVVEVEPATIRGGASGVLAPEGAELTSKLGERLKDAAGIIEDTVAGVASATLKAFEQVAPDEFSIELGMTFKGEGSPIPVLVRVGAEASIKVTATWKNK